MQVSGERDDRFNLAAAAQPLNWTDRLIVPQQLGAGGGEEPRRNCFRMYVVRERRKHPLQAPQHAVVGELKLWQPPAVSGVKSQQRARSQPLPHLTGRDC